MLLKVPSSKFRIKPMVTNLAGPMSSTRAEQARSAFSARLNEAMADAGHKPYGRASRLAEVFGVSTKGAGKWLKGESFPETSRIKTIADWLGVSTEWLLSGNGQKKPSISNDQTPTTKLPKNVEDGPEIRGSVPLISWVQAGDYAAVVNNIEPHETELRIDVTCQVKKHTYALRVRGDSMEPLFPDGTIIIVEPELESMPGDYVIVRNGSEEATFKQLIKDGSDFYLKPLNTRYPIKPLPKNATICGVVRYAQMRFR